MQTKVKIEEIQKPILSWKDICDKPGIYIPISYMEGRIIIKENSVGVIERFFVDFKNNFELLTCCIWEHGKFTQYTGKVEVVFN